MHLDSSEKKTGAEVSDRARGCLLGLAVGDALGAAVEFQPRGTFAPLTDMIGGGPFGLNPGEWTDDTSMALCLTMSLVEQGRFDPVDQMERYCRWRETGYLSSNGRCFDIGGTVSSALRRYRMTGNPFAGSSDPRSAGNGSLMRLAPVPLYFFPDEAAAVHYSAESSRTTHAAEECIDACRLLAGMICRAVAGKSKEDVLLGDANHFHGAPQIAAIAQGDYRTLSEEHIRGTGYVVDSLRAALWCFAHTETYAAAVLRAANLGDDADTTAAVCGQLAGAFYGERNIPERWLERLVLRGQIAALADTLIRRTHRSTVATSEPPPPIRATRTLGKTLPAPESREALGFEALFTDEEADALMYGFVPERMEDKWFVYYDDGWIRFHRSWTGILIYWLRLDRSPTRISVAESWVNRDPEQYRQTDTPYDRRLVRFLIDALLLKRSDAVFPLPAGSENAAPGLVQHVIAGSGHAEQE